MTELHPTSPQKPIAVTLILSGVVAGTLDILSAFIINPIVPPLIILKYIASAVLGGDAFAGDTCIAAVGLLLHYIIAFGWSALIIYSYPIVVKKLKSTLLFVLAYGLLVWCVMNLVIVPLSLAKSAPFTVEKVLLNMAALILCIALPSVLFARNYYRRQIVI